MEEETSQEGRSGALPEEYARKAVQFVINAHAATVNMRLYPATSTMVTETLEKAQDCLEELLEGGQSFSVSTLENVLLINDSRLDENEQQRAPVRSFIAWMAERGLSSIEFKPEVGVDEVRSVFEILGMMMEKQELRENLSEALTDKGVTNVMVNQRVYVAVGSEEDAAELKMGIGRKATPLDALKDELLIRYLMGKVDLGGLDNRELTDIISNPVKVGGLMSRFLSEEGAEGGVLVKSQKAEEALAKLSEMVSEIPDESLRETLSSSISGIVAEMSPGEMTSVLTGRATENIDITHVRENVITMIKDEQLLGIVDSLITEYIEMKSEIEQLDTAWVRERLNSLNELLIDVRTGIRDGALGEVIDSKLDKAGILEERDEATGARILSAYQMLGSPLGADDLPDLGEGIDRTVPRQICQLYSMGETDLAAGMLLKLADNLTAESPRVRRYASTLVKETLEVTQPDQMIMAASVVRPRLLETVALEQDYGAFTSLVDSLAAIARAYIREGNAEEASIVIEVLKGQTSPEGARSAEHSKHANMVVETMLGSEGLVSAEVLLSGDRESVLRKVRAMAKLGPEAIAPLVNVVKDRGQIEWREFAMEALGSVGSTGVAALVKELEKDNPWYVYRNVLCILADMRIPEAVEPVISMVNYPDERIRREAVRSLAKLGPPEALAIVQNATNDGSSAVRMTAVRVLGMFDDNSVAPFLLDIIHGKGPRGREEDQGVVEAACLALGDLGDRAYVGELVVLVGRGGLFRKGRPDQIRAAACIALGNIGDDRSLPVLEKATRDSNVVVRSSAEKALCKITGVGGHEVSPAETEGVPAGEVEGPQKPGQR